MATDERDAAESPEMEEDGSAGVGDIDSDDDQQVIPEPDVADDDGDPNSPLVSATAKDTVTVALPADSDPKWHRATEIVHPRPPPPPPIDDSRRLFQRLWTDEDEIELLRGFLDYVACHRGGGSGSHPPDTAPFYELIKSKLQLEFNKNQLVEKLRRLKKKYRNVMSKMGSGREVVFKSPHDQATFDISRKIWNQSGKIIGFEDIIEEPGGSQQHTNVNVDSDNNVLEKKGTVSRKRSRWRMGKMDEENNKPISLSDGPMASGATTTNENMAEFSDGRNLGGLIEETVKSCVSPLIKEMMNGTVGMMMAAVGGYPGGGGAHAMGVLSPMLIPNLGFGGGGGVKGGGVGDERWRRQQILELEVYSRRLELVQEQIRATVHELKTMPSGG
ncbi:DNA-binding storekeeper protein-related transcriptional regulator [Raphanus sativus]|uniref:Probable transcription factor At5g28040 n=1 Tax=Raphanus sativus TaxID=3726 RepID=A0A6J0L8U3_RAPSA|nr:probable transcription factor At5g28040 [Raphanus sativus]KAJ4877710.1 DNA-binding storekeeper protein-related transcriptional regulator [Raphanus sativus]